MRPGIGTLSIQIGTSYLLDVRLGQKSRTKAWFDQEITTEW